MMKNVTNLNPNHMLKQNVKFFALQMYERYLFLFLLCFSFSIIQLNDLNAQTVAKDLMTVTGKVLDEFNEPLPGVTVLESGTTNGTTSGLDGDFSLSLKRGAVLRFSFIGYKDLEIKVLNNKLEVQMEPDVKAIDEVIVTAYGKSTKASFTGSASVVKADEIAKLAPTNISEGLQGLSPGLQIINNSGRAGEDAVIMIRGLGSMTAGSNPLIVLDGIPTDAALNSINYSDIESISVLKDAASTSLYGSRAGNGVIMITTKRGKSGKVKVNLRSSWSTSEFAVGFPERVSPEKQYELTFEGLYNDATDFMGMDDSQARQYAYENVTKNYWSAKPFTDPQGNERLYRSGWNTDFPVGLDGKIKPDAKRLWNDDVFGQAFKHRLKQDYGIDLSGGLGESSDFFTSFSYLNDKGMYLADDFKRFSGRMALNTKINKYITLENRISYVNSTSKNRWFDARVFRVMPTEYSAFLWDHTTDNYKMNPYTGEKSLDQGLYNGRTWWPGWSPFGFMNEDFNEIKDNLQTNSTLNIQILPWLKFRTIYSYQLVNSTSKAIVSPWTEDRLNPQGGNINYGNSRNTSHTISNTLSSENTFGNHKLAFLIGQEAYKFESKGNGMGRGGVSSPYFTEISFGTKEPSVYSWTDNYRLLSFLGKADYDFANRYYLSASIRLDGTSRFAAENRWGVFWSLGGSWRLTSESFLESTKDWLDNLKLKASYGETGNDNVGFYAYQGLYNTTMYENQVGVFPAQLANSDIKWESNKQTNVGLDLGIFNRFTLSAEYFLRVSKNLLLDSPLAPSLGMGSILKNIGDIQNAGVEFDLTYSAFRTKDFNWDIAMNFSHYKNKITSLPKDEVIFSQALTQYIWKEGGSRYDIYTPHWADVNPENGRNRWWKYSFDEEGNITGREKTENYNDVNTRQQWFKMGSALPKLYGSLTNNFSYKNFDLSVMLYYSLGGKVYDYNYGESSVVRGNFAYYDFVDSRWQNPGDVTNSPKIYVNNCFDAFSNAKYSDFYLKNNNYMRLRNLTFGYTIPSEISKRVGVDMVRVYFRGDNLFTVGKMVKYGTDPENGGISGTIDGSSGVPALRSYNFGINVSF